MDNEQTPQRPNGQTKTSTHIRTLISRGVSNLTVRFYNTSLSVSMVPFGGKTQDGRDSYDKTRAILLTLNYDDASALHLAIQRILEADQSVTSIECPVTTFFGPTITLSWKRNGSTTEATLVGAASGNTVTFNFGKTMVTMVQNSQTTTSIIESGLSSFDQVLVGYLSGINADRHLDKLTDEYAKSQEGNQQQSGGGYQGQQGGYQRNNWAKNNQNRGGGYQKRPYNPNWNQPQNQNQSTRPPWQQQQQAQ